MNEICFLLYIEWDLLNTALFNINTRFQNWNPTSLQSSACTQLRTTVEDVLNSMFFISTKDSLFFCFLSSQQENKINMKMS